MTLKTTDDEFLQAWKSTGGSASQMAKLLNTSERNIYARRRNFEKKGITLLSSSAKSPDRKISPPPGRLELDIQDGQILIGSDVHVWPGNLTTAQRGFIALAKKLKPSAVIINGDLFDGSTVSRFPSSCYEAEKAPSVKQELEACQDFMDAVFKATSGARHIWTWGNHDYRFEARQTAALGEAYEGVPGFSLRDHFPGWTMAMSVFVNDSLVVKHRWKSSVHAPHLNTVMSGKSMCTGHLHALRVSPWTDYSGDRFGIDCGTLAEPHSAQFQRYVEDNPLNWRSGGVVLTFSGGRLMWPEVFQKWDENHIQFRGEIIPV